MSSERVTWALLLALGPAAAAVLLSPPNVYARAILGLGAFIATFPATYLLAGLRT